MTTIITMAIEKGIELVASEWKVELSHTKSYEQKKRAESRDEEHTKRPHYYQSNPGCSSISY